ncbi:MAG: DUF177 domain-containing protein [Ammonifex sp.]|nr:MAG: DUF177 domain-containing protein [Ammonifex sp.]
MFTISVARLKNAPAQQRRYLLSGGVEPFPGPGGEPVRILSPVELDLSVTNAGDFLWAVGEVSATIGLSCSRCIGEYAEKIAGRFEEKYRLHGGADEEGKEIPYAADEIDFTGHVTESLVLSLPMKPLCRESCLGLCQYCGKDLNSGGCSCQVDKGDPRLSVLKDLFGGIEGGGGGGGTEK